MIGYLPTTIKIDGREFAIYSDFRPCLLTIIAWQDTQLDIREKTIITLKNLYEEVPNNVEKAAVKAIEFLNAGTNDRETKSTEKKPVTMCWEQDQQLIFAGIAKTIGRDIRAEKYCHWWTFLSFFREMEDCTFTQVQQIRYKRKHGKKLEPHEQEYYRNNREIIELQRDKDELDSILEQIKDGRW